MMTLEQNAESYDEQKQFNFPEPGKYNARISSAKIETNTSTGKTNLVIQFTTTKPVVGKQITRWFSTLPTAQKWIVNLFRSAGLTPRGKSLEENMLINREVIIDVQKNDNDKVEVKWVNPAGSIPDNPVLDKQREQEIKDSQMNINQLPDSSSRGSSEAPY